MDNVFLSMLATKGMLSVGMKAPYIVLHQSHSFRHGNARVASVDFPELESYLGVSGEPIVVGQPFKYSNPQWGLAGSDLPEACFIEDKPQPHPCILT